MNRKQESAVDHTRVIWWVMALAFGTTAGMALSIQTGNLAVALFIAGTVLALGIGLERCSP